MSKMVFRVALVLLSLIAIYLACHAFAAWRIGETARQYFKELARGKEALRTGSPGALRELQARLNGRGWRARWREAARDFIPETQGVADDQLLEWLVEHEKELEYDKDCECWHTESAVP